MLITARSVWYVEAARYMRVPRCDYADRPANNTPSIENRLEDGVWHAHHEARWDADGSAFRVRIKPDVGPGNGFGIVTGIIERIIIRG